MLKKWEKRIAALSAGCLLFLMILPAASVSAVSGPVSPQKDYVALGDSIAFGYSDPVNGGFTDLYAKYLGDDYAYTNLSKSGYTTMDLLTVCLSNSSLIKKADVITICNGSKELMGPFISAFAGLYGINTADYTQPDGSDFMAALAVAVNKDMTDGGTTPEQKIALLTDISKPEARNLNASLSAGSLLFSFEWPAAMSMLHRMSPDAKIYVTNLYNPLFSSQLKSAAYKPLFDTLNFYMQNINKQMSYYSSRYHYKVVDVYKEFADPLKYSGMDVNPLTAPVAFCIPAALIIAGPGFSPNDPVSLALFILACDPHPTTVGHILIFEKIKSLG